MDNLIHYSSHNRRTFRFKVIAIIIIGIACLYLFTILVAPIISIRMVTTTSKQLAVYSKTAVMISASAAIAGVDMAGTVIRGTVDKTVSLASVMADATFDAIQLVADAFQYIAEVVPPITGMVVKNITDLIKLVALTNASVSGLVSEILDSGISEINALLIQSFSYIGDLSEVTSFLVSNALVPSIQALTGITEQVAKGIETMTKTELPRILDAIKFLGDTAQSQIFGDSGLALISLTVGLFTNFFKRIVGTVTDSSLITSLIESSISMIRSINLNVIGSVDFCEVLVGIIESGLNLLNLPGAADLNRCRTDFIRLGLWWMTGGIFCKTRSPITNFTDCLLGQIGSVTLIPGYSFEISASSLGYNIPDPGFPGLSQIVNLFNSLLNSLPSFSFGWSNISLNTLLSNLQAVLVFLFTDMRTLFLKETGGLLIGFSPNSGTGLIMLPAVLIYIIVKVATQFFNKLTDLIFGSGGFLSQALNVVNRWDGCVSFGLNVEVGLGKITLLGQTIFIYPIFEFKFQEWCISNLIGPVDYLISVVSNLATSIIQPLFNLQNMLIGFLGVNAESINLPALDQAIATALAQLTYNLNLPFFFRT